MKRIRAISVFLVVVSLLLPSLAFAYTQEEWNQICWSKTTGTVTLYALDTDENGTKTPREIGSLGSGVYIQVAGFDYDLRMYQVAYLKNGSDAVAYAYKEAPIVTAKKTIYFTDGSLTDVPEAVANDPAALKAWINRNDPGKTIAGDGSEPVMFEMDPLSPESQTTTNASSKKESDTVQGDWSGENQVSSAEKEFQAECGWRLQRTVTSYSDTKMTKMYEVINIGIYCQITTDFNDVVKIAYYKNGEKHFAHVYRSALLGSYTQYVDENGNTNSISSAHPDHASIIENCEVTWLAESIQKDLDAQVEAERSAAMNKEQVASSGETTVSLTSLGVATSTIVYNGEKKEVRTSELTFAQNVPEGKEIAVIYAPNTGKCSLRSTASESAKAIKQCKAGTVVSVLEYGSQFCMVNYNGQIGYVLTRCLQFHDSDVELLGTGMLTYNGKGTGRTTINIRHEASGNAVKIAEWKTGTEVTVFGLDDGWYEIEHNGMHGYVMEKFLTMQE